VTERLDDPPQFGRQWNGPDAPPGMRLAGTVPTDAALPKRTTALMTMPTDSRPSAPASAGGGEAASGAWAPPERRPRLARPTPSHLFAERRDDALGPRRDTRVIPALAEQAHAPAPIFSVDGPPDDAGSRDVPAEPPGATVPPPEPEPAPEFPPDIVLIVRDGGTVLYVNRPLGLRSEEEVVGSLITDWVFPEQHAAVRDALDRVFATGRADGVELHGIQGHDPDSWFECRIAPNQRDGRVVSVTIIARDVTRYKHTERDLAERVRELTRQVDERAADLALLRTELAASRGAGEGGVDVRLHDALDTAGEAIFLVDPATERLVDLNETAARWLRRHRGALVGQPVATLDVGFPILPPVGFDVQFTETRDTRRPLTLEGEHRRSDGSTFPVEISVIGHEHEGREYLLAVARDVKERRRAHEAMQESEAQWRALFDQSFDAVYLTTRGGEIVEANPAALRLFGYRRDEIIGLDARAIMPDVSDIRRFQQLMATERFVARMDATLRRQDGTAFRAVVSASRRRDAHDRLLGYQWVIRPAEDVAAVAAAAEAPILVPTPTGQLPRFTPPPQAVPPSLIARARQQAPAPTRASVPPPIRRHNGPSTPPAPAAGPTEGGVVLLVGGRTAGRRDSVQALERAGFAVLDAADATSALRLMRTHGETVHVAVVAGEPGAEAEEIARDLDALAHGMRVVLVRGEEADQAPPADLMDALVLREPVHPLALVQSVREARTRP
jgi:PAS domain S-box-containing protein